MSVKFTAPSGAEVEITVSSAETCGELFRLVLEKIEGKEFSKLNSTDVMGLLLTPKIKEILFKCMEKATYNNERITKDTFEDEKRRQDYFPISEAVMTANISPFFPPRLSE
jgi:hypothetical protein